MCTLTFIPKEKQIIVTVNRDEAPSRSASEPIVKQYEKHRLWLAPEPISGSSNLIFDIESKRLAVLLNGAFVPHERNPPYRKSRGEVILDSFLFKDLNEMAVTYNFVGIEPFTLVTIQNGVIFELRWDEKLAVSKSVDSQHPVIWSSTMMYRDNWQLERKRWFEDFLIVKTDVSADDMLDFHTNAGASDPHNALNMNRFNFVKTVSTTQIVINEMSSSVLLIDRITGATYQQNY
jgi:hypothetical protein